VEDVNVDCHASSPRPPAWPLNRRSNGTTDWATPGRAVSVKAKRAEALGALGRGEGIACLAVASSKKYETASGRLVSAGDQVEVSMPSTSSWPVGNGG